LKGILLASLIPARLRWNRWRSTKNESCIVSCMARRGSSHWGSGKHNNKCRRGKCDCNFGTALALYVSRQQVCAQFHVAHLHPSQDGDTKAPSQWTGPAPAQPPYDVESDKIRKYYLDQGAGFVQLPRRHMVGNPELKTWQQAVSDKAKLPTFWSQSDMHRM